MIRELLRTGQRDPHRAALRWRLLGAVSRQRDRSTRIAPIGPRGAGVRARADARRRLAYPFVELNREIERLAGCDVAEIHSLYGPSAYRRYERRALDDVVNRHRQAVIATPGGIVSDAATFNRLLDQCTTVWLQATPDEHMNRVLAQGDYRPMAGATGRWTTCGESWRAQPPRRGRAVSTAGKSIEEFAALRSAIESVLAAHTAAAG